MKRLGALLVLWGLVGSGVGEGAQIVSGRGAECTVYKLNRPLRLLKDPSLFLGALAEIYADPRLGWKKLLDETPFISELQGEVALMVFPEPALVSGPIGRWYAWRLRGRRASLKQIERKPLELLSVRVCGENRHADFLGAVSKTEFENARLALPTAGLPSSVYPNPVPMWKAR